MMENKKGIFGDILLILVFAAIGGLIFLFALLHGNGGVYAEVRTDGKVYGIYPLSENRTVEINGVGGRNLLVIENGQACMTDADCPDKLCVRQGKISLNGQSIICLPHKTVVEIVSENHSEGSSNDTDIIVK